jgi:hypothetical protein
VEASREDNATSLRSLEHVASHKVVAELDLGGEEILIARSRRR